MCRSHDVISFVPKYDMIHLTDQPIDVATLVDQARTPEAGAVVLFVGITRQFTEGQETSHLVYEAYREMAEVELQKLEAKARERWSLVDCQIVHRLGTVPLAEASVAIVTSSPHRREAFAAAEWLIDTLKGRVPIWKQDCRPDGTSQWIHPSEDDKPE